MAHDVTATVVDASFLPWCKPEDPVTVHHHAMSHTADLMGA